MIEWIEKTGQMAPVLFLLVFVLSNLLMIWRLGVLESRGLQGTVLGTLIMPYCSGLANLIFAFIMGQSGGDGRLVLENCLVNNVTNLTLLLGLPTIIWGMRLLAPASGKKKTGGKGSDEEQRINRLSLLLTLSAVLFFTGALWALALDGQLDQSDGFVLVGLFIFWQIFHVFDVKKYAISNNKKLGWGVWIDFSLLGVGAYLTYVSIEWLVSWVLLLGDDFFGAAGLGWLSGWLMVLPNAILVFYYSFKNRADIAYSSQIGDGHICIPLCVGLYAVHVNMNVPESFQMAIWLILGATCFHIGFLFVFGRLPRIAGFLLSAAYIVFLYKGLIE